jgi:RNA polymerase sigma factor (sigma-70 family)
LQKERNMTNATDLPDGVRQFPSTMWSRLIQLNDPAHPRHDELLSALIETYWRPAYHYIRALRRVQVDEALDLTQQFFTMLLQRGDFSRLSPERGSFRGFLKTALRNFVISNDRRKAARLPRGEARLISFDPNEVAWMQAAIPASEEPDVAFDREWARQVLFTAISELETRLTERGKQLYYQLFHDYCIAPSGVAWVQDALNEAQELSVNEAEPSSHQASESVAATPTYHELAQRYGINEDAVRNYLRYARRELRSILLGKVSNYLDGGDPEQELRDLLA